MQIKPGRSFKKRGSQKKEKARYGLTKKDTKKDEESNQSDRHLNSEKVMGQGVTCQKG